VEVQCFLEGGRRLVRTVAESEDLGEVSKRLRVVIDEVGQAARAVASRARRGAETRGNTRCAELQPDSGPAWGCFLSVVVLGVKRSASVRPFRCEVWCARAPRLI
jgi:hypothetical protein